MKRKLTQKCMMLLSSAHFNNLTKSTGHVTVEI